MCINTRRSSEEPSNFPIFRFPTTQSHHPCIHVVFGRLCVLFFGLLFYKKTTHTPGAPADRARKKEAVPQQAAGGRTSRHPGHSSLFSLLSVVRGPAARSLAGCLSISWATSSAKVVSLRARRARPEATRRWRTVRCRVLRRTPLHLDPVAMGHISMCRS